jgi:GT2 family glycosyltransferase
LDLQPAGQLQFLDGSPSTWLATGEDPWFRIGPVDRLAKLSPGWYRLRIDVDPAVGRLTSPCLYAEFEGNSSLELIPLPDPDAQGRIDVLVLLKQRVRMLRFDPSIKRGRFDLRHFELQHVGRGRALLQMLSGRRNAATDGRRLARTFSDIRRFARIAMTLGMSGAANDLFRRYADGLQRSCNDYTDWVSRYDSIGDSELEAMRARASQLLTGGPVISLLVPVYDTPERWLRQCLDSVLQQVYPRWELCVADDASPSVHVREILQEYARRDSRIKIALRPVNGHISEASNTALELATGDFIGLLDHDDELRPHALLEMAEAISAQPGLQMLYSDEDKIDEEGLRFNPYFKPDWNPDLLLSQNYVCHFTVIRTDLVKDSGGFRKGLEGSQDHDLVLRCSERLEPRQIGHVPKVLYHWRAIRGSTALERDAKDYAGVAGQRAVTEHLQRRGISAIVEPLAHGHYRVHWPLPDPQPLVSVIVPTRDRIELLRTCVESLLSRTRYQNYELVVVDNRSSDPVAMAYLDELRRHDRIRVVHYDAPFNYSAINNFAVSTSNGELLCLLNNDIEVISENWLTEMVAQASRDEVGAVGAMLYYPDDSIQHAGVILGVGGIANHAYAGQRRGHPGHGARALVTQNLSAITGACLVVRRSLYERLGGLDEALEVAFNDIDFCLRLQEAGYRNVWTPFAELYHHESASRGSDAEPEKAQRFLGEIQRMKRRWGSKLQRDPAYNPNLSLEDSNSGLAFPPRDAPSTDISHWDAIAR